MAVDMGVEVTVRESQTQQEVIGWDAPICGMTWGWTGT